MADDPPGEWCELYFCADNFPNRVGSELSADDPINALADGFVAFLDVECDDQGKKELFIIGKTDAVEAFSETARILKDTGHTDRSFTLAIR